MPTVSVHPLRVELTPAAAPVVVVIDDSPLLFVFCRLRDISFPTNLHLRQRHDGYQQSESLSLKRNPKATPNLKKATCRSILYSMPHVIIPQASSLSIIEDEKLRATCTSKINFDEKKHLSDRYFHTDKVSHVGASSSDLTSQTRDVFATKETSSINVLAF